LMRSRLCRIDQKGLTLLETLVAAVMSGILLAAAMPSLSGALNAHQLQAALRSTTNYVRVIRSIAVARNVQSRLVVSADGRTLSTEVRSAGVWTAAGQPLVLDGGVVVSAVTPLAGLEFNPQGTTNAASTISIQSAQGSTHTVSVSILGSVSS
ncbi:MAG: pilus assembly FimT family protein, partial [Candidatus Binatia bacterium]